MNIFIFTFWDFHETEDLLHEISKLKRFQTQSTSYGNAISDLKREYQIVYLYAYTTILHEKIPIL